MYKRQTYESEQLGQGKENSRNFLLSNPETANEIEHKILVKLGVIADPNAPAESAAPAVDASATPAIDEVDAQLAAAMNIEKTA